ncbi:MAG: hypothetical protein H7A45_00110 [Verrucomicrobiales bacterium]|nr:hypothetical protein [Verrucomicrobiales bacterium]MCP5525032.1 hypothetical protein [Verrucomicrobiales bacterium]
MNIRRTNGSPRIEGNHANNAHKHGQPSATPGPGPADTQLLPAFDGVHIPESWLEEAARTPGRPPRTAKEYDRARAACVADFEARRAREDKRRSGGRVQPISVSAVLWLWIGFRAVPLAVQGYDTLEAWIRVALMVAGLPTH